MQEIQETWVRSLDQEDILKWKWQLRRSREAVGSGLFRQDASERKGTTQTEETSTQLLGKHPSS